MGYFVTIEGIEGAGKSTLRSKLAEFTASLGLETIVTREPGATPLGAAVREIVLDPKNKRISPVAELMLFAADRAQHLEEIVRPALSRGALVICDRYIHSTLAYQGYGRGLEIGRLAELNHFVTGGLKPDLVLLLDLSPELGLTRARDRAKRASGTFQIDRSGAELKVSPQTNSLGSTNSEWTRFEEQDLAFHSRIRAGFLELAKDPANNFTVLDAHKSPEDLANSAIAAIKKILQ